MNVAAILARKGARVVTIPLAATLRETAAILDRERIGATVVVGPGGEARGVLSERDITREVARRGAAALEAAAESAMTKDVVTAGPADTLDQLLARMTDRRIRHLPVIVEGVLAGIVSIGDVVKAKIELAESEAAAMRDYIKSG